MTTKQETLEQKVERLEYYIDLLRDYIVDQDRFVLWDWAMAHRLNETEIRGIMKVTKEFNSRMQTVDSVTEYPDFDDYCEAINNLIDLESKPEGYKQTLNQKTILQMLNRLSKMGLFNNVSSYYLKTK